MPMADVTKALHRSNATGCYPLFSGPACTADTAVPENLLQFLPTHQRKIYENSHDFYIAARTPQSVLSIASLLLESGHEVAV